MATKKKTTKKKTAPKAAAKPDNSAVRASVEAALQCNNQAAAIRVLMDAIYPAG